MKKIQLCGWLDHAVLAAAMQSSASPVSILSDLIGRLYSLK